MTFRSVYLAVIEGGGHPHGQFFAGPRQSPGLTQQFTACPQVACRRPCPPRMVPCPSLDFPCPGKVPAPEETETTAVGEEGKGEPREDGEKRQKMELFVKESFEAKDELFPEKSSLLEELPADVNAEVEDQGPGGVVPAEAPKPAMLGATWEGNVIRAALLESQPRTRKHTPVGPGAGLHFRLLCL